MPNNRYQKLLDYISYFEREDINFCAWHSSSKSDDGVIQMGYPIYEEGIDRFIKDVYDSNLLMNDYLDYLKRNQINPGKLKVNIAQVDFQLPRAILTHSVRGERFCDGFWEKMIEEKIFLNILYRLRGISG